MGMAPVGRKAVILEIRKGRSIEMKRFCISLITSVLLTLQAGQGATAPTPNLLRNLDLQRYYLAAMRGEQVLELSTDQERFIALSLEQRTASPKGGILILHDIGHTPDWPYLLQQVRKVMPDMGWSTLSIDLPTPARDAIGRLPLGGVESDTAQVVESAADWEARLMARIQVGVGQLNQDGIFNIAVLGYGDGAYWGTKYLAERLSDEEKDSYALILFEPALNYPDLPELMASLQIPILDVYMNNSDFSAMQAKLRKGAVRRAKHPDYLQIHDAARQSFYGVPDIDRSTRRVWGWLRNHAAGYEAVLDGGN
jgi:hypothetical protein